MANVIVVGSQWGDEGKGKIVDWLERADVVVRYQGGQQCRPHAGDRRDEHKSALLPSGVVRGKLSVIGNGVVVWIRTISSPRSRSCGRAVTTPRC